MAESRREAGRAQRQADAAAERAGEAEKVTEGVAAQQAQRATESGVEETERAAERGLEALKQQTQGVDETGREAERQASETSARMFGGAAHTGLALTDTTEEIVKVWMHYAEDVMHNASQASEALSRSRTIPEMIQVQVRLLYDNMQSFFDHSAKIADTATRIVTRPIEALREESAEQRPR